ncbi:MAG: HAD family hydrolase [Anaerolineaceae bacterium]
MAELTLSKSIKAIFLDVGNTLRILVPDEAYQSAARKRLVELIGADVTPDEFCHELDRRYKVYRKWAFENKVEAHEPELWTRWLAPEYPAEKIVPIALELTYQYRQSMGRRVVAEDGRQVIIELFDRGYTLGIISNVITSEEIPDWLKEDDLEKYFKSVALSSVLGIRKPDPAIYHDAANKAGVKPSECVYVGDNLNRDVTGTREAGFGLVIILQDKREAVETVVCEDPPDLIIEKLSDLLDIFPPLTN